MQKKRLILLSFLLLFSIFLPSKYIYAEPKVRVFEENIVLFADNKGDEIDLYDDVETMNKILTLSDDSNAVLLGIENDKDMSLVRYTCEDGKIIEGYVENRFIVSLSNADQYRMSSNESVVPEEDKNEQQENNQTIEILSLQERDKSTIETETDEARTFSSTRLANPETEKTTSLLGHINNGNVNIYKNINGSSFKAGSKYTNAVYYIKKQAQFDGETYYLASKAPSSDRGVVGWIKSTDMSVYSHTEVDKQNKTFYVKGNGKATTKAWGGNKDAVYKNMASHKNALFQVHLTEKVGGDTWYRGVLNGKTVWLNSNQVYALKETSTSLLGHINNGNVNIYKNINGSSFKAGSKYTNAVYYIKKQTQFGGETYYLASKAPSSDRGVVGWIKSTDMSVYSHTEVDKQNKTFYVKGNGKATTKAWGGNKDAVYKNMASHKNALFQVHLTEKVGGDTWYRGVLNGKTVWLNSNQVYALKETSTSLLGHINNGNVNIYKNINGSLFKAGSKYTNAVYYIKKQTQFGGETYYLASTAPSSERGVVGWIKSTDMSVYSHTVVDKQNKTFYVKGNGKATTKAWGGNKDAIYKNMASHKNALFQVYLTEKVGGDTWYRGVLNGKTVWLNSNQVCALKETPTSLLGHINNGNVNIYKNINGSSFKAGSKYTNAVYYIKKQAKVGDEIFYLLSTSPSDKKGVVGWVKSGDVSTQTHTWVDSRSKTFLIKGNGKATTKAWGGKKDTLYPNLNRYKGQKFQVNLTEKVGNSTWYRGTLDGRTVWLHSSYLEPVGTIFVIDPGHGGKDPGASGNTLQEKVITLKIANAIKKHLVDNYRDVEVHMTRTSNSTYVSLEERAKVANNLNADYFLSVHINSGGGTGIESYIHSGKGATDEAKQHQKVIHQHLLANVDANDRGMKTANYSVLRNTNMSAILLEYLFIDTKTDAGKLKDDNYINQLGRATADGIAKSFNLSKK